MSSMDKYAGVQNPQLYQQILEEERKKRAREAQNRTSSSNFYSAMQSIGGGQSEAPASPAQEWTPEQRQAAFDLMGKTSSTNLYSNLQSQLRGQDYGASVQAPKPLSAWEKMDEESRGKVTSTNLYTMFQSVADGEQNWDAFREDMQRTPIASAPKPTAQPAEDPWNFEPIPMNEDGEYAGPMDWLHPQESKAEFNPKNEALGLALEEDRALADEYAQKGRGNEVVDMNTAKDFYDSLLTPEEIAALTPEQMEAVLAWCQMEDTRQEMYEQLVVHGQRGNYTWDNLVAHTEKMTQVVKYDQAIWRD